ncbi:MAG: hypothetical protein FWD28_01600 [Treponema sp.]|nr:hypothetical protein [Treponema sp.]
MKFLQNDVIEYLEADKKRNSKNGKWTEFEETLLQTFKMNAPISKYALECAVNRLENEPSTDSEIYTLKLINYLIDYFIQFEQLANTLDTIKTV